jgi:uncharacterized protein
MSNHIATVQNIYDAFGQGNIPAIIDQLSDQVQWEQWEDNSAQRSGVPWMLARRGKEGAREFFQALGNLRFTDFQVLSLMGNENQVAAEIAVGADVPAAGSHIRDEEIHLWTFDEQGKVVRFRHYCDTAKHIAAAGRIP